ncbi:MAG: prenyltransferase [Candidatus Aureabacteria bacterium]|nr:prenyltransferase [Candidatus Auribacterota bacterium]
MWKTATTWLRVSRANFLPASLLPFSLGSALAAREGRFAPFRFLLGIAVVAAAALAANLFNEYWDHLLEADAHGKNRAAHFGGSQSIQEGLVSPKRVHAAAALCLAASLAGGVALALAFRSPASFLFVGAGCLLAWAYTARPFSLAYHGLGEAAVFAAFGILLVNGGCLVQTGRISAPSLILSLPSGLLISTVLLVNEIADANDDRRAGKRNWAARFGRPFCGRLAAIFTLGAFLFPILGWLFRILPFSFLAILVALAPAIAALRALRTAVTRGTGFERSSARMISFYTIYHAAFIAIILVP